jgi:hypothetical protein
MFSTIGGEKGTKTPHEIFLDEELGSNKTPSRTGDYTRS